MINIRLQHFTRVGIDGATRFQWFRVGIILKHRITNRSPRIHDSRLTHSPNIQHFRMIKPEGVPVFMCSCSGIIQQIIQFEITGIAMNAIYK